MIVLDYSDTRPIYEQIVDKIQLYILKGIFEPDMQLPSVRSLAMELSINPNTIQKAYTELERQGYIYTIKGRGNFVRYDKALLVKRKKELLDQIEKILREAEELGYSRKEIFQEFKEEQ